MAAYNRCHLAFGAPIRDNMNGEIKLIQGVLGLNTQDGIDKILNTPIINDGSNGKLVLLIITIEEPSKHKPVLHATSNRKKKSKFMAAKNKTLAGNRTSDQSRALDKMIYRMQKANYNKGLGVQTKEQRRANGLLGYEKGLALLTYKQRLENHAKSLALTKYYCPPPTITNDTMHDLAMHDRVIQANFGTGIVKSVQRPVKNLGARAIVEFEDKLVGSKLVYINSLSCDGKRCQFAFVWNALDVQWMGMYQKLVAYKKQYMSTKVPRRYTKDPPLGKWVGRQRGLYKKNKLLDKRTELLNSINFVWSMY